MSRANVGLNAIYNGGLTSGYMPQGGAGIMDWFRKANDFAKKNKLVSKVGAVANAVGATNFLDSKTNGYFSKGVAEGANRGYGRRKKTTKKGSGKKKANRVAK